MIVATLLLGPGSEETAPDAIRSVLGEVEGFALIDGGGGYAPLEACIAAIDGKAKHWEHWYSWVGDYGDARNYALIVANTVGAEWAVTLDADERLHVKGLREQLATDPECNVWVCRFREQRGYHKPRAIRVSATEPCGGPVRWNGLVCEELQGIEYNRVLEGHFDELEKDDAGHEARARRGVELMPEMIRREPQNARWWRHKGECQIILGDPAGALRSFESMLDVCANRTESGWALYRILELEISFGQKPWARLSQCLIDYPDFVREFGWLACYMAQLDKQWSVAYNWAKIVTQCEVPFSRLCGHQSKTALPGCEEALKKIESAVYAKTQGEQT